MFSCIFELVSSDSFILVLAMENLKLKSCIILIVALLQYGSGQQTTAYNQQQNQNKVHLEDIERDNLKSTQTQIQAQQQQQSVQQQYVPYHSQQEQLLYSLAQQPVVSAPQQAVFNTPQSIYTPQASLYSTPPQAAYTPQQQTPYAQQQFLVQPYYQTQQQALPVMLDLSSFPFYSGAVYPFGSQPSQVSQTPLNLADYYKSIQPTSAPVKVPSGGAKAATQVPANNYLLTNPVQQAYYQQLAYSQVPSTPYYSGINAYYQPQKSLYSAGIKSTTPSSPTKGREEAFVPINSGNSYKYEFNDQTNSNYKIRGNSG